MADIAGINAAGGLLDSLRGLSAGTASPLVSALAATRLDATPSVVGAGANTGLFSQSAEAGAPAGFTPQLPSLVSESLSLRADSFFTLAGEPGAGEPGVAEEEEEEGAEAGVAPAETAEAAGPLSSDVFASLFEAGAGDAPTAGDVAGNFLNAARLL